MDDLIKTGGTIIECAKVWVYILLIECVSYTAKDLQVGKRLLPSCNRLVNRKNQTSDKVDAGQMQVDICRLALSLSRRTT